MAVEVPLSLNSSLKFPAIFIGIYLVLQILYLVAPEWLVKGLLVDQLTVKPSATLIDWWFSELPVGAKGSSITSPLGNINVARGCEGTETILMLIAAIMAAWRHWAYTLAGLVAGIALIFAINQIRIAGLFWIMLNHRDQFELFHGYLAPILVVGMAAVFFILWMRLAPSSHDETGNAAE
ncbi:MAG: archaeosortase/exosortase family protein [Pseudomonadota bacterium]|nr:archaeosortase/exosortase family protein [Pseudomonadota bacterium]